MKTIKSFVFIPTFCESLNKSIGILLSSTGQAEKHPVDTLWKIIIMNKIISIVLMCISASGSLVAQNGPNGLTVNSVAPDFTAKDQNGKTINLKSELKKNEVVVVFYRGEWCPFCNKELKALEDSLQWIRSKGAIVLAISPEKSENISKTIEKTKASYSILHDEGLKIMKSYDVAFQVDSLTLTKYKAYGIDFTAANGKSNGNNLPVPAVYVINKKGQITYRHFDPDYRKRPTIKEIASHL
jgi:peroxiredoxin